MMSVQNHCTPGHGTLPYQPYQPWGNYTTTRITRITHICPVCCGRGTVPRDFYRRQDEGGWTPDACRSCDKGIVWETRQEYVPTWVYPPTSSVTINGVPVSVVYSAGTVQNADTGGGWTP